MRRSPLFVLLTLPLLLVACPAQGTNQGQGTGSGPTTGDNCSDEFAAGQPQVSVATLRLCRREYISLYDPARKVPLVVAEHLTTSELTKTVGRSENFIPDPELSEGERAELSDFRGSGYSRGHMAPAGDFTAGQTQMDQSFYLSNMVPQNSSMNEGIWASLESATRSCTRSLGSLYILTGPVFEGRSRTIGPDKVAVPSSLYKVVVSGNQARAFIIPNRTLPQNSNFLRYETNVDEVQRAAGITFFPGGSVNAQARGSFCAGSYGS
jgi:endonuclease G, mitochondrial